LRYGIDSAPLTTDAGIDLVAYSPNNARSFTIQVKANLAPKPGGGKGAFAVDWWVSEDCPAQLFAFADISTRRVWILTKRQLASAAQQKSSGRLHFYMRTDSDSGLLGFERHGDAKFSRLLLENRVAKLFDSLLSYRELNPLLENLK
jgi:hypothetical protein